MRPGVDVERTDVMRSARFLSLLAGVLMALAAFPVSAAFPAGADVPEEPIAVEPARFLIETITVETNRTNAAGIIESETLLKEGGTYTEDDLRRAVARVHRLPFVLDASFSLRKGSERGTYELVIQADTARWFFFDRSVQLVSFDQLYTLGDLGDDDTFDLSHSGLVGGRVFVGRSGVVYGSWGFQNDLGSDAAGAQIGYTHYDLFDRGIVADLSFARHDCCSTDVLPFGIDPELSSWDWSRDDLVSLKVGIPLALHRSLQLGWTERRGEAHFRARVLEPVWDMVHDEVIDGEQDSRYLEARWVQDTSDDPILPSRGTVYSTGLAYESYHSHDVIARRFIRDPDGVFQPTEVIELPTSRGEQLAASVSAIRHWSVTPRQSVSAGAQVSAGRSRSNVGVGAQQLYESELDFYGGAVSGRHLLRLWTLREPDALGDLYLDTAVTYGIEGAWDYGLDEVERLELTTALTFRNPWGRLRLAFTFLDLGEVLR
jgi:hypothetical protein